MLEDIEKNRSIFPPNIALTSYIFMQHHQEGNNRFYIYLLFEPPHGKTYNLQMLKQRRRSASRERRS